MGKLIYSMIMSLDGFVADETGDFSWAEPDEEVHTFINDLERSIGIYLYGRRMYEVMSAWEAEDWWRDGPAFVREFARIWQAADKIVYSRNLEKAFTSRTRIERHFDPDVIRRLKARSETDISVAGPSLAAQAIEAGLVDEYDLFLAPVLVGAGKSCLPDGIRLKLELLDERRFGNGLVYLRYRAKL